MNQTCRRMEETLVEFRQGLLCKAIPDIDRNTDVTPPLYSVAAKNPPKSLLTPEAGKLAIDLVCNTDPSRIGLKFVAANQSLKFL